MALNTQNLIKGELDWHNKVNDNTKLIEDEINAMNGTTGVLRQAQDDDGTGGVVFQNPDGTTSLKDIGDIGGGGGGQSGRFKYSYMTRDLGSSGAGFNGQPVTYADDCASFLEASGAMNFNSWANSPLFDYFRPCVIAPDDLEPKYYLNPNNLAQKEDGTPSVITGADGDVMIEMKRLYFQERGTIGGDAVRKWTIQNYQEQGYIPTTMADGLAPDKIYIGVYKASTLATATTELRSVSGQTPRNNVSLTLLRAYARNRGVQYCLNTSFLHALFQNLFILLFRRKGTPVLGQGRANYTNSQATGAGNNGGNFMGSPTSNTTTVKFFGMEDWYGNVAEYIDGAIVAPNNTGCYYNVNPSTFNNDPTVGNTATLWYEMLSNNATPIIRNMAIAHVSGYITQYGFMFPESNVVTAQTGTWGSGTNGSTVYTNVDSLCYGIANSTTDPTYRAVAVGGGYRTRTAGAFHYDITNTLTANTVGFGARLVRYMG